MGAIIKILVTYLKSLNTLFLGDEDDGVIKKWNEYTTF